MALWIYRVTVVALLATIVVFLGRIDVTLDRNPRVVATEVHHHRTIDKVTVQAYEGITLTDIHSQVQKRLWEMGEE